MSMSREMGMSRNGRVRSAWRTSLHADERGPQRHRALSLVYERHADRGGACSDRRRRFWNVQADQRPGKRTERLYVGGAKMNPSASASRGPPIRGLMLIGLTPNATMDSVARWA